MIIGLFRAWRYFLLIMYDATSHGRLKPRGPESLSRLFLICPQIIPAYIYIYLKYKDLQSSALLSDFLKLIWTLGYNYIFSSSACYKTCRRI